MFSVVQLLVEPCFIQCIIFSTRCQFIWFFCFCHCWLVTMCIWHFFVIHQQSYSVFVLIFFYMKVIIKTQIHLDLNKMTWTMIDLIWSNYHNISLYLQRMTEMLFFWSDLYKSRMDIHPIYYCLFPINQHHSCLMPVPSHTMPYSHPFVTWWTP